MFGWLRAIFGSGSERHVPDEPSPAPRQWRIGGEWLKPSWYAFLNIFRYGLILGMFAVLLIMVVVLNEIMTFHNGIVEQVGEPYARRVVLMLDEIDRNQDDHPEERDLPVGQLAVELDGVRRALDGLDRFTKIEPAPTGSGAQGVERAELAQQSFTAWRNDLQEKVAKLEDTFKATSDFVPVASALNDLRESAREIENLQIRSDEGEADTVEDPGVELQGRISAMESKIQDLSGEAGALPHEFSLVDEIKQLSGLIAGLKESHFDAAWAENAVEGGAGTSTADLDAVKEPAANGVTNARAAAGDRPQPDEEGSGGGGSPSNAADEGLESGAKDTIKQRVDTIETILHRALPDYSMHADVSSRLQDLRTQAAVFDELVANDYRAEDAEPLSAEQAAERFDDTRRDLREKITDAETALASRTRVITLANVIRGNPDLSETGAAAISRSILHDFEALDRFQLLLGSLNVSPRRMATLSTGSIELMYIFMIGAIGSLIYITKYQLKLVVQGARLTAVPDRGLPWLLFRPFFGIIVAFAVYLLVRAGQFAFGSGGEDGVGTNLNIAILSVIALFAGLLAWQALDAIESRGRRWFSSQTREPLWATGLDNALRKNGAQITECAHQIGRSSEQVERWLLFRDMVPVEMQDRIATWLKKPIDELFDDEKPKDQLGGRPMWAIGLKAALDDREKQLDAVTLAELLREEDNAERIQKWINLKLQVSPPMQWRLVDLLGVPHSRLFTRDLEGLSIWAVRLRRAIEDDGESSQRLADRLGVNVNRIHAWKELEVAVPPEMQKRLMATLKRRFTELFEPEPKDETWFAKANGLGQAIEQHYGKRDLDAFAHDVDVDVPRVEAWIERINPVAKDTQRTILRVLRDTPDLFGTPRLP